jgi:hypothetical protein
MAQLWVPRAKRNLESPAFEAAFRAHPFDDGKQPLLDYKNQRNTDPRNGSIFVADQPTLETGSTLGGALRASSADSPPAIAHRTGCRGNDRAQKDSPAPEVPSIQRTAATMPTVLPRRVFNDPSILCFRAQMDVTNDTFYYFPIC